MLHTILTCLIRACTGRLNFDWMVEYGAIQYRAFKSKVNSCNIMPGALCLPCFNWSFIAFGEVRTLPLIPIPHSPATVGCVVATFDFIPLFGLSNFH